MTTTAPSTHDTLRDRIALALAQHDGEDALAAFRAGAAQDYWLGQADVALTVMEPALAEQAGELERLHHAWMAQRNQLTHARAERDYAFAQLQRQGETYDRTIRGLADQLRAVTAPRTAPGMPEPVAAEPATWSADDPEPPAYARAVRGNRTQHIYFRDTDHAGGRWIHRQTGNWLTWPALLRYEQSARLVNLGV